MIFSWTFIVMFLNDTQCPLILHLFFLPSKDLSCAGLVCVLYFASTYMQNLEFDQKDNQKCPSLIETTMSAEGTIDCQGRENKAGITNLEVP